MAERTIVRGEEWTRNGVKAGFHRNRGRIVWRMRRQGLGPGLTSVPSRRIMRLSHPLYTSLLAARTGQHQRGAQDGGLSACRSQNATRPIAATRPHRPLVLPTSTAFRKARLSRFAIRRSCSLPMRACAHCQTGVRRVSIACLPDPLFAIDIDSETKSFTLFAVIIIRGSLTLLPSPKPYNTSLISPRAAACQAFSGTQQKPCCTRPPSYPTLFYSLTLPLPRTHRN